MWVEALSEKKFSVGKPVVIVKLFDWLVRVPDAVTNFATTHTGVGTVPEVRPTVTYPSPVPLLLDICDEADRESPPGLLDGTTLKFTV